VTSLTTTTLQDFYRPRPWVRCWARLVDYNLYTLIAFFLLWIIPQALGNLLLGGFIGSMTFLFLILGGWIFLEALFLSALGTTPGKWLFRTEVRTNEGDLLTYSQALKRALKVLIAGMALEIPILSLIANLFTWQRLVRTGKTDWDRQGGFQVSTQPIGWSRILLVILVLIASSYAYQAMSLLILTGGGKPQVNWHIESWPLQPDNLPAPTLPSEPGPRRI
jgi:uncharacterized RDD family membrane protein YckC